MQNSKQKSERKQQSWRHQHVTNMANDFNPMSMEGTLNHTNACRRHCRSIHTQPQKHTAPTAPAYLEVPVPKPPGT